MVNFISTRLKCSLLAVSALALFVGSLNAEQADTTSTRAKVEALLEDRSQSTNPPNVTAEEFLRQFKKELEGFENCCGEQFQSLSKATSQLRFAVRTGAWLQNDDGPDPGTQKCIDDAVKFLELCLDVLDDVAQCYEWLSDDIDECAG
jgi:hypothetical protein